MLVKEIEVEWKQELITGWRCKIKSVREVKSCSEEIWSYLLFWRSRWYLVHLNFFASPKLRYQRDLFTRNHSVEEERLILPTPDIIPYFGKVDSPHRSWRKEIIILEMSSNNIHT